LARAIRLREVQSAVEAHLASLPSGGGAVWLLFLFALSQVSWRLRAGQFLPGDLQAGPAGPTAQLGTRWTSRKEIHNPARPRAAPYRAGAAARSGCASLAVRQDSPPGFGVANSLVTCTDASGPTHLAAPRRGAPAKCFDWPTGTSPWLAARSMGLGRGKLALLQRCTNIIANEMEASFLERFEGLFSPASIGSLSASSAVRTSSARSIAGSPDPT
jgi:hypothetical protein